MGRTLKLNLAHSPEHLDREVLRPRTMPRVGTLRRSLVRSLHTSYGSGSRYVTTMPDVLRGDRAKCKRLILDQSARLHYKVVALGVASHGVGARLCTRKTSDDSHVLHRN